MGGLGSGCGAVPSTTSRNAQKDGDTSAALCASWASRELHCAAIILRPMWVGHMGEHLLFEALGVKKGPKNGPSYTHS